MVKYDLIFKVMKIVLQKWLCVMLLVASMSACALQQRKPIMKERPGVVRQMVENRDFKVDFSATSGGGGWSFLGAEIPFYMQISGDILHSFMSYDIWTRPGLEYVYARPYKHGEPFPSKYIISDYEVTIGTKDSIIIRFTFRMSLNMNGDDIIVPRTSWYSEFEDRVDYEVEQVPVCCKMVVVRNGDVVVYFVREKDRKTFVVYRGHFVFNRTKEAS